MKKITEKAVNAWVNDRNFELDNTKVIIETDEDGYYRKELTLFNNVIAFKSHPEGRIFISNCGWVTNTTRERLNGLLQKLDLGGVYIKNWVMYYKNTLDEVQEMGEGYTMVR